MVSGNSPVIVDTGRYITKVCWGQRIARQGLEFHDVEYLIGSRNRRRRTPELLRRGYWLGRWTSVGKRKYCEAAEHGAARQNPTPSIVHLHPLCASWRRFPQHTV